MRFLIVAREQVAMQQMMQPRPKTIGLQAAPSRPRRRGFIETLVLRLTLSVLAFLIVPATLGGNLLGQTRAPQAKPAPTGPFEDHAAPVQSLPVPAAIDARPSASPVPVRPDNPPSNQARVSWDGRDLKIVASNSSLDQVLHQVAALTGAKLEGLVQDQRIFGTYGPGPGCEVLSKLLAGSDYNVLMVGSRDAGAPLQIVLSARSAGSPQSAANNQHRSSTEHDETSKQREPEPQRDYPPQPSPPQPIQNPFGNGAPTPRDPLEFMQEILERQQRIDKQQQPDRQNNPQQ